MINIHKVRWGTWHDDGPHHHLIDGVDVDQRFWMLWHELPEYRDWLPYYIVTDGHEEPELLMICNYCNHEFMTDDSDWRYIGKSTVSIWDHTYAVRCPHCKRNVELGASKLPKEWGKRHSFDCDGDIVQDDFSVKPSIGKTVGKTVGKVAAVGVGVLLLAALFGGSKK